MAAEHVLYTSSEVAKAFDALAHARRVRILRVLAEAKGPVCFGELQKQLKLSNRVLAHHLKKMEQGTLIERREKGRFTEFYVTPHTLRCIFGRIDGLLKA